MLVQGTSNSMKTRKATPHFRNSLAKGNSDISTAPTPNFINDQGATSQPCAILLFCPLGRLCTSHAPPPLPIGTVTLRAPIFLMPL